MGAGYFQYLGLFLGAWRSSSIFALSTNDIQRAIIEKLKADTTLVGELGGSTEIREDSWPGSDWTYPTIRVDMRTLAPGSNGKCHLTIWDAEFSILIFTEPTSSNGVYDASSGKCADLMDCVVDALFGKELTSDMFHTETRIGIVNQTGPIPELPPGGWRGEVACSISLQEIS